MTSAIPLSPNSSSNRGTSSKKRIGISVLARRARGIPGCVGGARLHPSGVEEAEEDSEAGRVVGGRVVPGWRVV